MRITGYGSHDGKTLNGNGDVASAEHLSGIDHISRLDKVMDFVK